MAQNRRVIYSSQAVAFAPEGGVSYTPVHGAQSFSTTVNFNLDPTFEIGQQAIYENVEGTPDVSVTLTKVLDGYPPLVTLATQNATDSTLVARAAQKCMFGYAIHLDTVSAATGVPLAECIISGAQLSSLSYTFGSDGNFTEDVGLVAQDKLFKTGNFLLTNFGVATFDADEPLSIGGSGGVQQRQDFLWFPGTGVFSAGRDVNGAVDTDEFTILPTNVDGITSSGMNDLNSDGSHTAHVQSISVSTDLGREDIFELGRRTQYARFANPLNEVTTSISVLANLGDRITATEAGYLGNGENLSNQTIKIRVKEGLLVDCGIKNKLASVEYGGGDAGGGNATITYTFTNYNDMSVRHPMDPTVALRIAGPHATNS